MLPENRSFMIRGDDGQEYGPVDLGELREWVQENRAGLGTEVRLDEPDAPWHPWQNYPELIALLAEVHVTSPVPGLPGLVLAPVGRRVLAFALDLFLIGIPTLIICDTMLLIYFPDWVSQYVGSVNQLILNVEAGNQTPFTPPNPPEHAYIMAEMIRDLIMVLYFTAFQVVHGKTPGKAVLGLRVVGPTGQNPGLFKAVLRAFVLIFSISLLFLPLFYIFFNPQRRAIHDLVSETYVVKT